MDINYNQLGAQQGWQCPICKRVLSPWTVECPCRGQVSSITTTTLEPDVVIMPYDTTVVSQNNE